ncbi:MAG: BMP family ABC transporter substrate-binding protein [Rhizobiales bacterium]|nr:BMP family ABC transporter substrate-binding protein [Hyphomicrobiales bacterium]MBA68489.1 BMP family ABC transporter substrate-binding protein [Hyphomicrobiales bacterium]
MHFRTLTSTVAALAATFAVLSGPTMAQEEFSAVYVMSDNLGDMGFNDNAATGFKRAEEEGVKTRLLQASPTDPQLWRQNLEAVSNSGDWDVIFTGPNMHDNLAAVAPQHPDQKYVFFDDQLDEPNVLSIKYAQNEGSYLAGALAAIAATDKEDFPLTDGEPKIAVVAGMDLPVIQDFILGFKQGAATIEPDIQIQVIFIGNFNDAQKAYDLTNTAIENGANVVYNVAGPAGLGILKAAADSDKYAIGVDSDQNGIHPDNVLASMLKQIGNSIYTSIGQIKDGTAEFGTLKTFGLEDDGVALVYNDALVPDSVKAKIDEAKAKVVDGEIEVDSAF